MKNNLILAIAISATLAGCADLKEFEGGSALGGLVTITKSGPGQQQPSTTSASGSPILSATPQREAQPGTKACGERREDVIDLAVDVDTAYVRLKRHFRYPTLEERKRNSWGFIDEGFRHETSPGARYWMKNGVKVVMDGKLFKGWLSTEIERNGPTSTVYLRYCIGGIEGFNGVPADFPQKLIAQVRAAAERKRSQ
ncbi:MAG TPA: hypothetical protein ENK43_00600 [Planctomycetes bacterium]|nr:hypothetical protein [Planctomycetota bacterium]